MFAVQPCGYATVFFAFAKKKKRFSQTKNYHYASMLMLNAEIPKGHKNDYFQKRFSLSWF